MWFDDMSDEDWEALDECYMDPDPCMWACNWDLCDECWENIEMPCEDECWQPDECWECYDNFDWENWEDPCEHCWETEDMECWEDCWVDPCEESGHCWWE